MRKYFARKRKVPTLKVKVTIRSEFKLCLKSCCSYTTKANLIKLHRNLKHNEKVCCAYDFGSYAQGQGRNQVRGQNPVSAINKKLLKQIKRNFTERSNVIRRCVECKS